MKNRAMAALSLLVAGMVGIGVAAQTPAPAPAATPATPENAATFMGDWTLSGNGANGPANFALTVKPDKGKVVAEIVMAQQGTQAVTDLSKVGASLVLRYSFDYQGMPIPVILSLTPNGDKVDMEMDFASGAYQVAGTATKKGK